MLRHVTHNNILNFFKGLFPLARETHCGYTSQYSYHYLNSRLILHMSLIWVLSVLCLAYLWAWRTLQRRPRWALRRQCYPSAERYWRMARQRWSTRSSRLWWATRCQPSWACSCPHATLGCSIRTRRTPSRRRRSEPLSRLKSGFKKQDWFITFQRDRAWLFDFG